MFIQGQRMKVTSCGFARSTQCSVRTTALHDVSTSVSAHCFRPTVHFCISSALTFGGVDHLSIYCSGDDRLGEILQVAAQAITQDRKFQLIQVSRGWICNAKQHSILKLILALKAQNDVQTCNMPHGLCKTRSTEILDIFFLPEAPSFLYLSAALHKWNYTCFK